jgi:hypothetical protein
VAEDLLKMLTEIPSIHAEQINLTQEIISPFPDAEIQSGPPLRTPAARRYFRTACFRSECKSVGRSQVVHEAFPCAARILCRLQAPTGPEYLVERPRDAWLYHISSILSILHPVMVCECGHLQQPDPASKSRVAGGIQAQKISQ